MQPPGVSGRNPTCKRDLLPGSLHLMHPGLGPPALISVHLCEWEAFRPAAPELHRQPGTAKQTTPKSERKGLGNHPHHLESSIRHFPFCNHPLRSYIRPEPYAHSEPATSSPSFLAGQVWAQPLPRVHPPLSTSPDRAQVRPRYIGLTGASRLPDCASQPGLSRPAKAQSPGLQAGKGVLKGRPRHPLWS